MVVAESRRATVLMVVMVSSSAWLRSAMFERDVILRQDHTVVNSYFQNCAIIFAGTITSESHESTIELGKPLQLIQRSIALEPIRA